MCWTEFTRRAAAPLALILSLGLVACGDDDPIEPEGLTQAEVGIMMEALVAAGGFGIESIGLGIGASPAAAPARIDLSGPIDALVDCPGGARWA